MTKILVIEDEQTLREDILEILGYENFEVLGAENGVRGVEAARIHRPDLIICDIMMPELDGYGVITELHSETVTAMIPFIFLTAKTGHTDRRRGMALGADDYLTKPFTQPELIEAINIRLEKEKLRREEANKQLDDLRINVVRALPHEFRTPLTGIIGYTRMLIEDIANFDKDEVKKMAEGIDRSAHRLQRLIENYLLYAQVEFLSIDPVRLATLRRTTVAEAMLIMSDVASQKARDYNRTGDLVCQCEGEVTLQCGLDSLTKIVNEVIDNAFKFSVAGTPVEVVAQELGEVLRITITNQGRGMTAEQIKEIGAYMQFERRMYEQSGLGLGLIIAKRLTELHLGRFNVTSVPDETTKVTIEIPKHKEIAT